MRNLLLDHYTHHATTPHVEFAIKTVWEFYKKNVATSPILVPIAEPDLHCKIAQMKDILNYFKQLDTHRSDIVHQLEESITSLGSGELLLADPSEGSISKSCRVCLHHVWAMIISADESSCFQVQ